jgi:hypothetical protein
LYVISSPDHHEQADAVTGADRQLMVQPLVSSFASESRSQVMLSAS